MDKKEKKIHPVRIERLKELMKREKFTTQSDFAAYIGYTPQAISAIINGINDLSEDMAETIVNFFPEYRMDWLMGYDSNRTLADKAETDYQAIDDIETACDTLLQSAADNLKKHLDTSQYDDMLDKIYNITDCDSIVNDSTLSEDTEKAIEDYDELKSELKDFASFLVVRYVTAAQRSDEKSKQLDELIKNLPSDF